MNSLFIVPAVVGAVELIRRLFKRDFEAATIIVVAAVIGGLAGYYGFEQVTVAEGIVLGLAGSGLITTVQKVGQSA